MHYQQCQLDADQFFDFFISRDLSFGDEKTVSHIVNTELVTIFDVDKMAESVAVDSMSSSEASGTDKGRR